MQKVHYSLPGLTLIIYLHFRQMILVLTRTDYPQIVERRKQMLSCKHPAHTLQNTEHIVGRSSLQITDSLTKVFNRFSLFAIRVSELHEIYFILSPLNTSASLLFQISQITLVLNMKIACSFKLLQYDKDGQDTETPTVTELYSSFFHSVINTFCIISQMLTFVTICICPRVSYDKN